MILVLGGTTEANQLIQLLIEKNIRAIVSTAYDFAEEFIPKDPLITHRSGKLNRDGLQALIKQNAIKVVVDATHPYALEVSDNARIACEATAARYVRLERDSSETVEGANIYRSATHEEAIVKACELGNTIFIATGSNHAKALFDAAKGKHCDIYIRVLPDEASINKCLEAGFAKDRIITGIGPFSYEDNRMLWDELGIDVVITKDSGVVGGLPEKLKAAEVLAISVIVVDRPHPASEGSLSIPEIVRALENYQAT
ncbi:MAG: precorrin-6A reductase [Candidatus Aquicultor sp.]